MELDFCPELNALLRTRRAVGQSGKVFEGLGALSTAHNLEILRGLMLERKPARTLEIGLSFGGSALLFAATHRDLGHPPNAPHVAIDPHQATAWDNAGIAILKTAGLDGFVDVRPAFSSIELARLAGEGQRFDLIYVDGSHLFEDVFVDAYFGLRILSDDGVILFDDCPIDHVAKVLSFIETNWSHWVEEIDLSPYRADGRTLRYQAGKRLGKLQLRAFRRIAPPSRPADSPLRKF